MGIFGDNFLKGIFDMDGDGRLDAGESFIRDMFVIEELMSEKDRRKIKGESWSDDDYDD